MKVCRVLAGVVGLGLWGLIWIIPAQCEPAKEFLLSLVQPTEFKESQLELDNPIEKLLAQPLSLWKQETSWIRIPLRAEYLRMERERQKQRELTALFPGEQSLERLRDSWHLIASLKPVSAPAMRRGVKILDSDQMFFDAGRKVGDPIDIYTGFEIQVDRSKYTLNLYGLKNFNERTLLFSCRTGLGSPEYPTPKGTYYLVRIFDDRPIWIPPPSDWAYGQLPSHSVYGGHMLPFFVKTPLNPKQSEEMITDLDNISPQMKLVDGGMYRIHGTDSPWSIGSSQSHGCVRLLNSSVKQLADTLKMYVGTTTRGETANGVYINLAKPVRLILF